MQFDDPHSETFIPVELQQCISVTLGLREVFRPQFATFMLTLRARLYLTSKTWKTTVFRNRLVDTQVLDFSQLNQHFVVQILTVLGDSAKNAQVLRTYEKPRVMLAKTAVSLPGEIEGFFEKNLRNLVNLRELCIAGASGEGFEVLTKAIEYLPQLSVFHALHCDISNGIPKLVENGAGITDLDLSFFDHRTPTNKQHAVTSIVQMTQLRRLSLQHYNYMTNVHYSFLRNTITKLEKLELSHNVMSSEDVFELTSLTHLSLRSHSTSSFVFSDAYRGVGRHLTNLRHLELAATGVEGYMISMHECLKPLTSLTYLNTDGFQPMSRGEWKALLTDLPNLRTLIANPTRNNNQELQNPKFISKFPNLKLEFWATEKAPQADLISKYG